MQVTKPPHKRYALYCLDNETYVKYANAYSGYKRWNIQGIYIFLSGTGLWDVAKEVAQGTVVKYGKRRLAIIIIGGASYISAVAVITNKICIMKFCKLVYTSVGYVTEVDENASNVLFLLLDLELFGQSILANKDRHFNFYSNITDVIDNLSAIEDS